MFFAPCGSRVMTELDKRREAVRLRLLRLLSEKPNASTRDMAAHLGISNGAAYYLLKALIDKGLVKSQSFSKSNNKAAYLYIITPSGIKQKLRLTEKFLEVKRAEYNQLHAEIEAMEAELVHAQLWKTQ